MSYSFRNLFRGWKVRAFDVSATRSPRTRKPLGQLTKLEDRTVPTAAAVSDFVWFDANANGVQDNSEGGVSAVTVKLLNAGGGTVATTNTDSNGLYSFKGVAPGQYMVQFDPQVAGWAFTAADKGGDDKFDSDVTDFVNHRTALFTLTAGQNNTTVDCGLIKPVSAQLGDFVWFDVNSNGLQDQGEPGIPNITVNLLNSGGGFLQTTKTDNNGLYLFANLAPGGYRVEFVKAPADIFSPANVGGDDKIDSDADPVTGRTGVVTLAAGDINTTVDAGITKPVPPKKGKLGDFVFVDTNCNGVFDKGEQGLPNVTVRLLNSGGTVIATTTTSSTGFYLFDNLDAGNYSVEFALPAGYTFTKANAGGDDSIDSDVTSGTGPNPTFTVPAGPAQPSAWTGRTGGVALAQGESNLTVDAGVLVLKQVSGYVYVDANDNGVFDPNEAPIAGVQINFAGTNHKGEAVNISGLTDVNGFYQITNIVPGTYAITETQPTGYLDGKDTAGTPFAVTVGNDQFTDLMIDCSSTNKVGANYNFGELLPSSIRGTVWYDVNNNKTRDANDPGIGGVKITLTGTDNRGNVINRDLYTGADGTYEFTGLRPGTYQLNETQPVGFEDSLDFVGTFDGVNPNGVLGNDVISHIQIPFNSNGFRYDFSEIITNNGKGNKEDLLASSKNTPAPTLLQQSASLPGSPTYANAVSNTKLSSPSFLHFAASGQATGGSKVRVYDYSTGVTKYEFDAYPGFAGGVRVAIADVTGDSIPDIITAPGAGGGPHIKVFSGATGQIVSQFFAYAPSLGNGVYVAAGDLNGDGVSEIVTTPGEGAGPHVRIFNAAGVVQSEYFAYASSVQTGVRVAVGDVNGDGKADVMTVPGPGVNSHVKVFNGLSQTVLNEYYAYAAGFSGGAYIASGDVDGDGKMDVITGAASGGGPHVKVFKGGTDGQVVSEWFAYEPTFLGGVSVGALDINGDGKAEVITAPASKFTSYVQMRDVARGAYMEAFLAYPTSYLGGAFVTGGTRRNISDLLGG